jgi:hypothetical protein
MSKKFTPENVKQDFYNKYSNVSNYKELTIKKNITTTNLKKLFNNNSWNLKDQAQELEKKQIIEHNNFYNAFLSDVYLLDYKKEPKIKTITIKDFNNYKFNEGKTERNELNYINTFKSWINNILGRYGGCCFGVVVSVSVTRRARRDRINLQNKI